MYHVLGIVLRAEDVVVNKADRVPALTELMLSRRGKTKTGRK